VLSRAVTPLLQRWAPDPRQSTRTDRIPTFELQATNLARRISYWYRSNIGLTEVSRPELIERPYPRVTVMARNKVGVTLVSSSRTRPSADPQVLCFVLDGPLLLHPAQSRSQKRSGDRRTRSTFCPTKQCRSKFVSAKGLPETGVFAVLAGDFSEILAIVADFWSLETNRERAKTPQMQAFRAQIDRNLRSSECLAGAGGIEPPNGGIKTCLIIQ
jgi:hypothetical protein